MNPIASGGYAWVVFTSRRMYGNVATIPPFCSDPRGVDLVTNITTKKLWVAAVDLTQAPGTDASHPAFYLPAQELLAGNSRGFWVLDPCRADGASCTTRRPVLQRLLRGRGDGGALVCSNAPPEQHVLRAAATSARRPPTAATRPTSASTASARCRARSSAPPRRVGSHGPSASWKMRVTRPIASSRATGFIPMVAVPDSVEATLWRTWTFISGSSKSW